MYKYLLDTQAASHLVCCYPRGQAIAAMKNPEEENFGAFLCSQKNKTKTDGDENLCDVQYANFERDGFFHITRMSGRSSNVSLSHIWCPLWHRLHDQGPHDAVPCAQVRGGSAQDGYNITRETSHDREQTITSQQVCFIKCWFAGYSFHRYRWIKMLDDGLKYPFSQNLIHRYRWINFLWRNVKSTFVSSESRKMFGVDD